MHPQREIYTSRQLNPAAAERCAGASVSIYRTPAAAAGHRTYALTGGHGRCKLLHELAYAVIVY
jgi:hypothetical protein